MRYLLSLMGDKVEPRREFIQKMLKKVSNFRYIMLNMR